MRLETPLTLDRARAIIDHAENEFGAGRRIEYSFTPFKNGGASSPLEALLALKLIIAEYYKSVCIAHRGEPSAMKGFDDYVRASERIALRVFFESTEIESISNRLGPEMVASLKKGESTESFTHFLRTLSPASADYWPEVYQRLMLEYPDSQVTLPPQNLKTAKQKAWWHFW